MSRPAPEVQIAFLRQIQRLFSEGEFTATYKFALLLALAELAVEWGDDSGEPLELSIEEIGEKFAELYWRQLAQYTSGQPGTSSAVLVQNYGNQAAVVRKLRELYDTSAGRLSIARGDQKKWSTAVRDVASTVSTMPLQYLQVLGGKLEPFLYDYPCPRRRVILKPGVAYNLRAYQGLIQQMARAGWVEHIRGNRLNAPMLGQIDDLESFMFGSARASLSDVAGILAPMQGRRCFYCNERIDGRGEVDHFIPWARYPRDTAHNFVLTHRHCNHDKRDLLAAQFHLERWMSHLERMGREIGEQLAALGFVADAGSTKRIARWAYQQGVDSSSIAWLGWGQREPLTEACLRLFVGEDG
jgi:5-methylcytosine-specific restriction endonuclease McrA